MRRLATILVFFVMAVFFAGCGMFSGGIDGVGDASKYDLDGSFDEKIVVDQGDSFVLNMSNPKKSGYAVEGAVFDPTLVRLDKYIEVKGEEPGDAGRVLYLFTAVTAGSTDISIKVSKPADSTYPVEVFKTVHLVIEDD